eukprot:CAMPEP_0177583756 /NCGR_PEP_ID=MMETSP0419_2-20121207/3495_1 /TAXON_ID=582737 /ORGANISM="Tetraselmis sp., Strain GSL018" /LENGTH=113 /DNA_ID=CAMNT_0019073175 /DNA_START=149 /DNA_END=487 /DNA_ORIENTATION=-
MTSDDTLEVKVREIQRRQAKWMRERQAYLERSRAEDELRQERGCFPSGPASASDNQQTEQQIQSVSSGKRNEQASNYNPEDVVSRLTEKITDRLRSELRLELQGEAERAGRAQ